MNEVKQSIHVGEAEACALLLNTHTHRITHTCRLRRSFENESVRPSEGGVVGKGARGAKARGPRRAALTGRPSNSAPSSAANCQQ
jgi:hypothetical protein